MDPKTPQTMEYGAPTVAPAWSLTRATAWTCVYPLLTAAFVYGTWLTAALTLGRTPVIYLDDPSGISRATFALQSGAVLLLVLGIPFSFVHVLVATVGLVESIIADSAKNWRQFRW